jgi:hypothetical protein
MATRLESLVEHPALWQEAYDLAVKQEHDMWAPTHAIVVNGKVEGHIGLGGIPLVTMHYNCDLNAPISLREVQKRGQQILEDHQHDKHFIVVPPVSPAYPLMPALGYQEFPTTLWFKEHG